MLAPERPGPHNWEDVGLRTMLAAIDALAAAEPAADAARLIVHGHSRGGHGAWALATRLADRVLGVASACGWYSREECAPLPAPPPTPLAARHARLALAADGDANNLWVHETSLMHADKALVGLLHAAVAENDNALHASTLRGLPALVRVGTQDQAQLISRRSRPDRAPIARRSRPDLAPISPRARGGARRRCPRGSAGAWRACCRHDATPDIASAVPPLPQARAHCPLRTPPLTTPRRSMARWWSSTSSLRAIGGGTRIGRTTAE